MFKLEYVDLVRYEAGIPKAMLLLADRKCMCEKRIAVFGTGSEAYSACQFMEQNGFRVERFLNND